MIYLQNKPSRPWGRAAQSSGCTCAPTGRSRSSVCCHLRKSCNKSRKFARPASHCPVWVGFPGCFFFNPWTLQDNMEASRSDNSSLARVAAFVGALVAGYFREAWPMCLGGVRAYWPREQRGARCKGIPPPAGQPAGPQETSIIQN